MKNTKSGLHKANLHRQGYDFGLLEVALPEIMEYVILNPDNEKTIDFSNATAVKLLNKALLIHHYNLKYWDIPEGYLCPPIPGRSDYILNIIDLLSEDFYKKRAKGKKIKMFDLGVGANCVYPLIAHQLFNWSCTGSDIDDVALANASEIIERNKLNEGIKLVKQNDEKSLVKGLIGEEEHYDVIVCNPPFHDNEEAAKESAQTKWEKLGKEENADNLNFGGMRNELWCEGGELAFVKRLITESSEMPKKVMWFSSLISQKAHLDELISFLNESPDGEYRIIPMAQGQKQSRILAWTFLNQKQRKAWAQYRWS